MMEDRIQVNGVWYVKETTKPISDIVSMIDIDEFDVTRSLHRIWEDSEYAFEAKILLAPDGIALEDTWGDCWLIITEKVGDTNDSWIEHSIDNPEWMLGVLRGDRESMRLAYEIFDNIGIYHFRGFINILIQKGWLEAQ